MAPIVLFSEGSVLGVVRGGVFSQEIRVSPGWRPEKNREKLWFLVGNPPEVAAGVAVPKAASDVLTGNCRLTHRQWGRIQRARIGQIVAVLEELGITLPWEHRESARAIARHLWAQVDWEREKKRRAARERAVNGAPLGGWLHPRLSPG